MLKADEEEVANMWADLIDSDFVKRPDVLKNFWNDYSKILDPSYGIKSLEDLDFALIRDFLKKRREEKKEWPWEERKTELEER